MAGQWIILTQNKEHHIKVNSHPSQGWCPLEALAAGVSGIYTRALPHTLRTPEQERTCRSSAKQNNGQG